MVHKVIEHHSIIPPGGWSPSDGLLARYRRFCVIICLLIWQRNSPGGLVILRRVASTWRSRLSSLMYTPNMFLLAPCWLSHRPSLRCDVLNLSFGSSSRYFEMVTWLLSSQCQYMGHDTSIVVQYDCSIERVFCSSSYQSLVLHVILIWLPSSMVR